MMGTLLTVGLHSNVSSASEAVGPESPVMIQSLGTTRENSKDRLEDAAEALTVDLARETRVWIKTLLGLLALVYCRSYIVILESSWETQTSD